MQTRDTKEEVLAKLKSHLERLQAQYPIRSLSLFGSVARDEAGPESDVDLLIDFSEPVGMEIVDLVWELEAILDEKVDIVTKNSLRPDFRESIEQELIHV